MKYEVQVSLGRMIYSVFLDIYGDPRRKRNKFFEIFQIQTKEDKVELRELPPGNDRMPVRSQTLVCAER